MFVQGLMGKLRVKVHTLTAHTLLRGRMNVTKCSNIMDKCRHESQGKAKETGKQQSEVGLSVETTKDENLKAQTKKKNSSGVGYPKANA